MLARADEKEVGYKAACRSVARMLGVEWEGQGLTALIARLTLSTDTMLADRLEYDLRSIEYAVGRMREMVGAPKGGHDGQP
jgi:hypothetical protein